MERVTCIHCGKQFKKESGLAYHLGWTHKSASSESEDNDFLHALFGEVEADTVDLKQLPSPEEQAELLKQIEQQLGRLQGHLLDRVGTEHTSEGSCATCYEMLYDIGRRGMMTGAAAILSIPGVREANAFNDWARARNAKNSESSADPVVTSWVEVPGIQKDLKVYYEDADFQSDLFGEDSDSALELLLTGRASPHDD